MFYNETCVSPTVGAAPALFSAALNFFAASQCFLHDDFVSDTVEDRLHYDFIVIGGGSAGSVVAHRLSEIPQWDVLLLEAGPQPPVESAIPLLDSSLDSTKYDWQYQTVNDGKASQAFENGSVPWPRGKMLGGSSAINLMLYLKGFEKDYETWEQLGNPSWTVENVYKHFKSVESFQNEKISEDPYVRSLYGHDGPQVLNRFNFTDMDLINEVLKSYNEIGIKNTEDINTTKFKSPGISAHTTVTAAGGMRFSTYKSFLSPVRNRSNLKVVTKAFVKQILINENSRAYGVKVDINGKQYELLANLEVIVSAGSINTPQLLMLSGVGPKDHLESKNISCKIDLQGVGRNLQDHIDVYIPIFGDGTDPTNEADNYYNYIKYLYDKTGTLTQGRATDVVAFFDRNNNSTYPEFQCHFGIVNKNNTDSLETLITFYKDSVKKTYLEQIQNKTLYIFFFQNLHPLSRGQVLLDTSDPYDKPLIYANYFDNPMDLQMTSAGIRRITKIINTTYFKSVNAFLHRVNWPECDQYELDSDLYWQCQAKNTATTIFHPVGTSKMGPDPKDCVVDNYLKVHYVTGLRVIDASIMPTITSGNTNGPTIMIGEMGADMIKQEYNAN